MTIAFSEPATGIEESEIEVDNGTGGNFSGSGATYSLQVTPDSDFEGDVTVTVPAGVAEDSSMNTNKAVSATFKVDTLAPVLATNGRSHGERCDPDADVRRSTQGREGCDLGIHGDGRDDTIGNRRVGDGHDRAIDVERAGSERRDGHRSGLRPPVPGTIVDAVGNQAASITTGR